VDTGANGVLSQLQFSHIVLTDSDSWLPALFLLTNENKLGLRFVDANARVRVHYPGAFINDSSQTKPGQGIKRA